MSILPLSLPLLSSNVFCPILSLVRVDERLSGMKRVQSGVSNSFLDYSTPPMYSTLFILISQNGRNSVMNEDSSVNCFDTSFLWSSFVLFPLRESVGFHISTSFAFCRLNERLGQNSERQVRQMACQLKRRSLTNGLP